MLIVSKMHLIDNLDAAPNEATKAESFPMAVVVALAEGGECERCWIYSDTVSHDDEHAVLCERCSSVVKQLS